MPPPELARNAPVVDVVHPVQINGFVVLRSKTNVAVRNRGDRFVGERLNLEEPLHRQARFHHGSTALAFANRHRVIFDTYQKSLSFEVGEHARTRFVAVEPCVCAAVPVHARVLIHDLQHGQIVPLAYHEIVGIVRRRHLHRACSEFGIGQFVGDDRDLTIH